MHRKRKKNRRNVEKPIFYHCPHCESVMPMYRYVYPEAGREMLVCSECGGVLWFKLK